MGRRREGRKEREYEDTNMGREMREGMKRRE